MSPPPGAYLRLFQRSFVLVLALTVLTTGCGGGDSQGPDRPSLDGTWLGGTVSGSFTFQITMTLAQDGDQITGTGTITGTGPTCGVSIDGTRSGTAIALSITCPGFQPIGFSGEQHSRSTINGRVAGSGLPTTSFDLIRQ